MAMDEGSAVQLVVTGEGRSRSVPLDPAGTVVGRAGDCDVALDSPRVSRRHARLWRDPFERWVVEDLESRNGTWVGSLRIVEPRVLEPAESLRVGPFTLAIGRSRLDRAIAPDVTIADVKASVGESASAHLVTQKADTEEVLSGQRLRQMEEIIDRLAGTASLEQLYPAACRAMAEDAETFAAVVLLTRDDRPMPYAMTLLACAGRGVDSSDPAAEAGVHLSRRVLERVRSTGQAVTASNVLLRHAQLTLTVVDPDKPSAVFCAPVRVHGETVEALYVDVPAAAAPPDMADFVRAVARQVGFARKSLNLATFTAERHTLDRQLQLAREIQLGFTPDALDEFTDVDLAVLYEPAMWVGGDYYDVWRLADGRIAFAVGDVAGKGLPAAMVMTSLHTALRMTVNQTPHPGDALDRVGSHLYRHLPGGLFVTMVLAVFDPPSGALEFVNAGHILPLVLAADSPRDLGVVANPPLGVIEEPFVTQQATLADGEALVVVTDGITESMNEADEQFSRDGLLATLRQTGPRAAAELTAAVAAAAEQFRHDRAQQDDITVFVLHTRPHGRD